MEAVVSHGGGDIKSDDVEGRTYRPTPSLLCSA
jgi:hypothetical protein